MRGGHSARSTTQSQTLVNVRLHPCHTQALYLTHIRRPTWLKETPTPSLLENVESGLGSSLYEVPPDRGLIIPRVPIQPDARIFFRKVGTAAIDKTYR